MTCDATGCDKQATFRLGRPAAQSRKLACSNHLIQIIRYLMEYESPLDIRIWQRQ